MLTFPTAFFGPQSIAVRLVGASVAGPASVSGQVQRGELAGGGHWEAEFGASVLWTRAKFNTWEAIAAEADNGATQFVVPICDRRRQPFGDPKRPEPVTFSDDSTFSDGAEWTDSGVTASLNTSAALRATEITFNFAADGDLIGGEHFTIWHASGAQRLYRVGRILDVSGGVASCKIRPPLREPCTSGTALDFDNPRCQMSVVGDMAAQLEMLKRGSGQVKFVENFAPVG